MVPNKTVVLGEAPESDSEDVSLDVEIQLGPLQQQTLSDDNHAGIFEGTSTVNKDTGTTNKTVFGSSLLASLSSASAISRLVSYNLLPQPQSTTDSTTTDTSLNQLPPLHKNLYTKNHQLYNCMDHLYKHPYEKAAKDLHTISQRLVGVQRIIQDVDSAVMKIKREKKHLEDLQVELIHPLSRS